jgi:hypothetical protein
MQELLGDDVAKARHTCMHACICSFMSLVNSLTGKRGVPRGREVRLQGNIESSIPVQHCRSGGTEGSGFAVAHKHGDLRAIAAGHEHLLHDVVIWVVRHLEWRSVEQLGFQGGHCCMQAPPRSFSSKGKHHTACGFTTQDNTHEKGRLIEDGP